MEVTKEDGNDGAKANLVVGAAAIGAAIACLPLFSLFSKMLPGNKYPFIFTTLIRTTTLTHSQTFAWSLFL